ncbi:MAG: hypothetical protein LBO71_09840 [Prevotellaceae bacterium]|nr:hypothetical protein [Prevotellaceae bacterium]
MVRTIMHAQQLSSVMQLPLQMQNGKVEVIVLPVVEAKEALEAFRATGSMKGCLRQYANPALAEQEKNAWAINVKEKYGNHTIYTFDRELKKHLSR